MKNFITPLKFSFSATLTSWYPSLISAHLLLQTIIKAHIYNQGQLTLQPWLRKLEYPEITLGNKERTWKLPTGRPQARTQAKKRCTVAPVQRLVQSKTTVYVMHFMSFNNKGRWSYMYCMCVRGLINIDWLK